MNLHDFTRDSNNELNEEVKENEKSVQFLSRPIHASISSVGKSKRRTSELF